MQTSRQKQLHLKPEPRPALNQQVPQQALQKMPLPQQAVRNRKKSLLRDAVQQQRQLQAVLLPMELPYPRLLKERRSTPSRHLKQQQSQHRLNILLVLLVRPVRPTHRPKHQHGQRRLNALLVRPLNRLKHQHGQQRPNALPARPTHRLKHQHGQRQPNVPLAQPMYQHNAQAARPTHQLNVPLAQPMRLPHGPLAYLRRNAIMAQIPNKGSVPVAPVRLISVTTDQ